MVQLMQKRGDSDENDEYQAIGRQSVPHDVHNSLTFQDHEVFVLDYSEGVQGVNKNNLSSMPDVLNVSSISMEFTNPIQIIDCDKTPLEVFK